jgi:hypothetical protein
MAPDSPTTLQSLRDKNPPAPSDRRAYPEADSAGQTLLIDAASVRKAIMSFPPGSSGGPDGLTAEHLRDMISCEGEAGLLLAATTSFIHLIVAGGIPEAVKPLFFGGRLIALSKKDGGVRPIVVGLTFRRLAAKIVNNHAVEKFIPLFSPIQMGVGGRARVGGCSTRHSQLPPAASSGFRSCEIRLLQRLQFCAA